MLGDLDGIAVVFSVEVDAASLRPSAFLVVLADGSRVFPTEAILAPASEGDENRTVLLVGDFGDPRRRPPADVLVIRPLHAESGQSLQGLLSPVTGYDEGGKIVVAQRVETPCEGGGQRIRTYWTDGLRGVQAEDLAAITVELADGGTARPRAFDDHRLQAQDSEDNVLDLCVMGSSPAIRVSVAAGVFTDPPGHLNVATQTPVAPAAAAK